ncbi:katanin p60 ATPase-containing subunit A-like 2 [Drosophila grimshawi]|uniref:GH24269 n=1 Tax=Drosophila grimshawi TaxID=7222 RepID=B4JMU2_DROGR|nr:katanin p60 ATPase-containing subunit A-like 2 [Drosophila grimshawi]EDV92035.1 GH24269 [Drosophila grimshawi]
MKPHTKYGVSATAASTALCEDVRNFTTRRRNLLYLMHRYLQENGYYGTAEALKGEGKLSEEYELCDNIDLDAIYLEYASFFNMKFGKYPRILKKMGPKLKLELNSTTKPILKEHSQSQSQLQSQLQLPLPLPLTGSQSQTQLQSQQQACWHAGIGATTAAAAASLTTDTGQAGQLGGQLKASSLPLHVKKMETGETLATQDTVRRLNALSEIEHGHAGDDALFDSLEWQSLAELVKTSILCEDIKLRWSDICGNQRPIELVKEAVLTPIEYPQLFINGLKPWRSLLLHGPPGSGKTFLAKALYAETRGIVTFFNITASIMVSKWRGESEKILRVLFHMAARRAPSVIFFDEIESLTSRRDRSTDHESSKRFKNELLQLLDGMEHTLSGVFVLASTNLPWDIDEAFLRRFEKKLLIQLPSAAERTTLIQRLLGSTVSLSGRQLELLVRQSEHFTGDEIRLACKEICMQRMRCATRGGKETTTTTTTKPDTNQEATLERAFKQIKPLGIKLLAKHEQWQQENGS